MRRVILATAFLVAVCAMLLGVSGCDSLSDTTAIAPAAPTAHKEPDLVAETFEELYPVFLYRKSMSAGEKAARWRHYRGRWVRWEGVLSSFTTNGATFKHLVTTSTFDISVICDKVGFASARTRFEPGDRVRYTARLDNFDDMFRTIYLTNGVLIEKVPHGDLGVPVDMAHPVVVP